MNRFSRPLILAAALCFAILLDLAVSTSVAHASNRRLVYQGRVLRPDGLPLEGVFRVQVKIYSPDPKRCLLWGEEKDVAFDKGAFSLEAGDPLKRLSGADAGGATNFTNAFLNESALALTGLTCSDGDTYTPGSTDDRVMVVTLHDGGNVVRTFDGPIKAVPFALHATNSEMIGGYSAPFLMKVNPVAAHEPSRSFSTLGFSILYDLAESNSVDFGGKLLQGLTEPIQPQDAATKNYVDQVLSTSLGTLNVVKLVDAISASTGLIAVTGGPITSEGTFSFGFLDQTSGVLAAPTGGAGQPLFRLLEDADISAVDATKITGTLQVAQGGLGYGSFTGGVIPVFNVLSNRFEGMACNPGDVLVWMAPIGWTCEPKTTGAVTSVDLLMPLDLFNVTGGPVTNAGSFDVQLNTQPVGFVFAAPTGPTGDSGVPTFRALASSDLPGLDASKIVSGTFDVARVPDLDASKIVSGILGVDRGGTGLDGSVATTGQLLIGDGAGGFALGNLVGSSGVLIDNYGGSIGISLDPLASGAVTHVGFEAPTGLFSVIGSPLTGAGTISLNLGTQGIAQVFAAPTGAVGVPEFRSLVASDITAGIFDVLRIPDLDASKIVSGTLGVERGGTGLDGSVATTGQLLIGDGTGGFALGNLVGSSGVLIDNYGGSIGISLDPLASGAVTHVGFDAPTSVFSVSGAPLTGAGTISLSFGTQNTAQVFAAPTGAAGVPEFRSLIASDITAGIFDVLRIPDLDAAKIVSGTLGVERGGTGLDGSVATTGQLLIGDGTGGFALGNLVGSSGVLIDNFGGSIGISLDPLASGAVTHVGFEAPTGLFSVIGSPLTGAGTISLNLGTQGVAHVFAAPTGASGVPEFRSLVASDIMAGIFDVLRIPDLDAAKIVSGTLGVERGGTGLDGSVATTGQLLIGDGTGGFALGNLVGSSGVLIDNFGGSIGISLDPLASGAVTHVGLEAPTSVFNISGAPLTGAGTISLSFGTQNTAQVFAAPTGASGVPEFRSLIASDITAGTFDVLRIPDLDASKIVSGTLAVERGGTGLDGSVATTGQLLIGNGTGGFALGNLVGSSGVLIDNFGGSIGISLDPLASGAVTHVGFEAPTGIFSVIGSPLTGAGTIALTLGTQNTAQVLAAPTGASGVPEFRSLIASDITAGTFDVARIPDLDASKIVSGTLAVERGGTGLDGSVATTGQLLIGDGTGGFALGNLVGGTGVSITNQSGSITISTAGGTLGWVQGGNSFGQTGTFGTNDAQDLAIRTAGTTRVNISALGDISIGGPIAAGRIAIYDRDLSILNDDAWADAQLSQFSADKYSNFVLRRGRGTRAVPFYLQPGDIIGALSFRNHLNNDGAGLYGRATEAHSAGAAGTRVEIETIPNGATTALGRLVVDHDGRIVIGAGTMATEHAILDLQGTGSLASSVVLPRDTSANRPASPVPGMIRYNTDLGKYEVYENSQWVNIQTSTGTVSGSVTHVGLTAPSAVFEVSGGPITGAGTLQLSLGTQAVSTVFAAPTGASGTPSFRRLAMADLTDGTLAFNQGGNSFGQVADLGTNDNRDLNFRTNGTTRVTLSSMGFVGIGRPDPKTLLDVDGDMTLSPNSLYGFNMYWDIPSSSYKVMHAGYGAGLKVNGSGDLYFLQSTGSVGADVTTSLRIPIFMAANGQVGINTATPGAALDIASNGTLGSAIRIPQDTSANRPASPTVGMIRYNTDLNKYEVYESSQWMSLQTSVGTGGLAWNHGGNAFGMTGTLGTSDAHALAIRTGGTTRMTLTAGGSIGLGNLNPQAPVHVGADLTLEGDWPAVGFNASANETRISANPAARILSAYSNRNLNFMVAPSGAAGSAISWHTAMVINNDSNYVGIGTTAPSGRLHVEGGEAILGPISGSAGETGRLQLRELAANGTNGVSLRAPDALAANYTLTLPAATGSTGQFLATDGAGNLAWATNPGGTLGWVHGGNSFGVTGTLGTNDAQDLAIRTAGTTRMTFTAGGSIGIGTATPGAEFDMNTSTNNSLDMRILNTNAGASAKANFTVESNAAALNVSAYSTAGGGLAQIQTGAAQLDIRNYDAAGQILFATANTGRVLISSTGQVGIGTLAPSGRLHVEGGEAIIGPIATGAGNAGSLQLRELASNGTNGVSLRSPDALAANYTLTLPAATGSTGQFLATDGAGNLAWATNPGGTLGWVQGGNSFGVTGTLGTNDNQALTLRTNNMSRMMINAGGSIGIGTDMPQALLHIGSDGDMGALTPSIIIGDNNPTGRPQLALVDFGHSIGLLGTDTDGFFTMAAETPNGLKFKVDGDYSGNFIDTATTAMTITPSANVGIGTTAPSGRLHVEGGEAIIGPIATGAGNAGRLQLRELTANGTNGVSLRAADAMAANYTLTLPAATGTSGQLLMTDGAGNLGWITNSGGSLNWSQGGNSFGQTGTLGTNDAQDLTIRTAGTTRMTITAGGSLGIGTATPNAPLHISRPYNTAGVGDVFMNLERTGDNTGGGPFLAFTDDGVRRAAVGAVRTGTNAGDLLFYTQHNSGTTTWDNAIGFNEKMRLTAGGNLGIGVNNPSNILAISGSNNGSGMNVVLTNTSTGTLAHTHFQAANDGAMRTSVGITSSGYLPTWLQPNEGYLSSSANNGLHIATMTNNRPIKFSTGHTTTPLERMRITDAGQVGIGTTAPSGRLHIEGGEAIIGPIATGAGNAGSLQLRELAVNGTNGISLRAPDTLAANYALTLPAATGSTGQFLATDGAGNLSWATNPGGTLGWVQGGNSFGQTGTLGTNDNQDLALRTNGTTRLHITNSGYVGIGTTSGTHALNVNGNINLMNATDSIRLNGNAIFSRYPGQWGHINTFIGTERPMSSLNTAMAWGNLAIGYDSGNSLTLGGGNTSVGIYSSRNVTDAINNTAIGFSALSGTGVGSGNTVIGSHALNNSTNATTGGNTAVGAHALHQLTSGVDITAIGNSAGYDLQTGGHNLFIGRGAGAGLVNGARNIFIGSSNLTAPTGTMNDFMTIGNLIYGRSMTGTGTTSAGRVGIRTDDPQAVLDVFGTGADSAMLIPRDTTANRPTGVDGMIRYNSQTSKFEGFQAGLWTDMIASGAGTLGWAQGGNSFGQTGTLGTNDNQPLVFETNNVARMTLGTNGFLGIGSIAPINGLTIGAANNPDLSAISVVNTDSSTARYPSVVAVNYMGSANLGHPMLAVVNSRGNYGGPAPVVAGDTLGALEFRGRLANYTELPGAGILGLAEQNFATGVAGSYLSFRTTNLNAGALSEKMRITANGNVGIGITAPSGLLHVEGGEIIAGPVATGAGNSGRLQLRELAANGTNGVSLRAADAMAANYTLTLPAATGTSGQLLMTDGAGNLGWATNTGGTLNWSQGGNSFGQTGTLGTNDSHPLALRTAGTTRMTINSGGSVGIGTDTPVATLNVNGSAQIERSLTVYNHSANVYSPNGSAMAPEGGGHWFYNPSATAGAASSLIIGSRNGTGYNHAYLGAVAPASGYTPSIVIGQQTAATTYAERLRIDANGYMGLGTTAPSGRLHVRNTGTTMPSLSTDTEIIVQNNSGASSQAGISIIGGTTGYSSIAMGDGAAQYRAWIGSDNANSALRFGTGLNEQARIAADGKMGLGTAVPTELLHLSGGNMLLSPVSAGAGNTARLRMRELVANGSHAVSLRAPDSIAADFTLTLPAATGSSGQLLTTDGSGNLGWVNNTGGTLNWSQGGNAFGQTGTLGTNDNNALAFRTNNNTRMTITPGGAVGIGTSNPDQTLTVEDTTFVGISIKATNGYTHAFPGLNIDAYQGGSFAGHPRINFFNARGSEASTNPTPAGLHLGVINFMGYTGSDAEFSSAIYAVSDATFTAGSSPSSLVFTTTPAGSTSSTERMIIKGSGNVGIGTTAPSGRLHVDGGEIIAGPIAAGGGNSGRIQLRELAANGTNGVSLRAADTMASNYTLTLPAGTGTNGQILQTDASGNLSWVTNSGGTTNWAQGGNSFGQTGTIGTNDNQALAFETNNNTRMFINSGGSVAIGTGTPEGLMDVRGMLSIGPSHSGINNPNSVLVARSPDTFNPHFILEKVGQNTGGFALDNNNFIMASEMADITFRTGVNYQGDYTTTGSEVMRIKNNGNVGIGETDPDDMLHISAAPGEKARARFSAWGGIYHRHYSIGTDGSTSTIDPPYFDFSIRDEDAGQDRLTVAWSSGYVGIGEIDPDERLHVNGNVLATAYLYSSDVRLKKDFVLLDHSLEKLLELEPVTYRWIHPQNPEADREQIGLKAQQVRDVYPQAVREDDKGFLRLDYPALIAPVIKAIQELYYELVGVKRSIASKAEQTDVDALKADNEAKDREIRQLKQENEAIKGWICAKDPNAELCR